MNELQKTNAKAIKKAYGKMLGAGRRTIALSLEIGNMLIQDKERIPHGGYKPYLEKLGINKMTAHRLTEAANDPKKFIESNPENAILEYEKSNKLLLLKAQKKVDLEQKKKDLAELLTKQVEENKPTIYLKDCNTFLNTLDDNSMDLLITDPPYSTDVKNIKEFAESWVDLALSKIKPDGRAFICIGAYPKELKVYLDILLKQDKFIVDNPLIWTYKNTLGVTPKMKYNLNYQVILHLYSENSEPLENSITAEMWSVQAINAPDGRLGDRYHTWQKPDELAMRLIRHSTKEGDTIIDPFTCTGTFPLIAAKLNRKAFGCDISEENLTIAKQRGCTIVGK